MKTINITIVILAIITNPILSQSTLFPIENASWNYNHVDPFDGSGTIDVHGYELEDDSLYNAYEYTKVESSGNFEGLIRRDEQKVYFVPKDSLNEILLYDFGLEVGDTMNLDEYHQFPLSQGLVVSSIDTIMTNDSIYRKEFHFENAPGTWIEGIGSNYGSVIKPFYLIASSAGSLKCFWKGTVNVFEIVTYVTYDYYEVVAYDCNGIITSINKIKPKNQIKIYPNPFNTKITVEDVDGIEELTLLDSNLRIIKCVKNANELKLETYISSGLYLIRIKTKDKIYLRRLIRI